MFLSNMTIRSTLTLVRLIRINKLPKIICYDNRFIKKIKFYEAERDRVCCYLECGGQQLPLLPGLRGLASGEDGNVY